MLRKNDGRFQYIAFRYVLQSVIEQINDCVVGG